MASVFSETSVIASHGYGYCFYLMTSFIAFVQWLCLLCLYDGFGHCFVGWHIWRFKNHQHVNVEDHHPNCHLHDGESHQSCRTYLETRDVYTSFIANRISVVENRFKTRDYWPSYKFKFQAQLNLVIHDFFAGHICSFDENFCKHSTLSNCVN